MNPRALDIKSVDQLMSPESACWSVSRHRPADKVQVDLLVIVPEGWWGMGSSGASRCEVVKGC